MNPANANSPSWPSTMGTRTAASNWLVQCIVWSAIPMGLLLMLKGLLMAFWQMTLSFWGDALQLSLVTQLSPEGQTLLWTPLDDGSFAPSAQLLVVTAAMTAGIWWLGNRLSERFYPLKISLRAMCLIQWCACLFFWLTPSHFPYSIGSHADALMGMGANAGDRPHAGSGLGHFACASLAKTGGATGLHGLLCPDAAAQNLAACVVPRAGVHFVHAFAFFVLWRFAGLVDLHSAIRLAGQHNASVALEP